MRSALGIMLALTTLCSSSSFVIYHRSLPIRPLFKARALSLNSKYPKSQPPSTPPLLSLSELLQHLSPETALHLDLWGLLHSGSEPYPGVLGALSALHSKNVPMIVISNSSKRRASSLKHLSSLGFDVNHFHSVITSGEVAHDYLLQLIDAEPSSHSFPSFLPSGPQTFFVFGSNSEDDLSFVTDTGHFVCHDVKSATAILARGCFAIHADPPVTGFTETPYKEAATSFLNEAARLGKPMVVCNPDLKRPDPTRSDDNLDVMPGR